MMWFTVAPASENYSQSVAYNEALEQISDDFFALLSVTLLAGLGLGTNGLSLFIIQQSKRFRNAFGVLCVAYHLFNSQAIVIVLIWTYIVLLIVGGPIPPALDALGGQLSNCAFYGTIVIHLFIAINRFYAIALPVAYSRLFTVTKAITLCAAVWILVMSVGCIYYISGCAYKFDPIIFVWHFDDTACGQWLGMTMDYILILIVVAVMLLVDIGTIIKITKYHQACSSSIVFTVALSIFHFSGFFVSGKWAVFFCTTATWLLAHTIDGAILAIFNRGVLFRSENVTAVTSIAITKQPRNQAKTRC